MQIKIEGLSKLAKAAEGTSKAASSIQDLLTREAQRFANKAVANIKEKYLSGPRPEKLGVVTGRLRSSIRYLLQEASNGVTVRLGTDVIYAATHEFGDMSRGIKQRAFLQPGTEDMIPELQERIEQLLTRVAGEGISGK